jgi:hypothetical protein
VRQQANTQLVWQHKRITWVTLHPCYAGCLPAACQATLKNNPHKAQAHTAGDELDDKSKSRPARTNSKLLTTTKKFS